MLPGDFTVTRKWQAISASFNRCRASRWSAPNLRSGIAKLYLTTAGRRSHSGGNCQPDVLNDPANPARHHYLKRFADFAGRSFLRRFYEKYEGETADQALQTLATGVHLTPLRAAVIFRSVRPQARLKDFSGFSTRALARIRPGGCGYF